MKILLFILFPLSCISQTRLPKLAQQFSINEKVIGSYTMRGVDIGNTLHEVLDLTTNVKDGNTYTAITPTYFNPFIGNTLTSMSFDIFNFSTNQITWTGTPTANDGSVLLNGTSQNGTITYSSTYFPSGNVSFTMSMWFKFTSNTSNVELFSIGNNNSASNRFAFWYFGSNSLGCEWIGSGRGFSWTYGTAWHMLTISYSGGSTATSLVFYLDASVQSSTSLVGSDITLNIGSGGGSQVQIGSIAGSPASSRFPGSIQMPMVILSVLSSTQVTSLYNFGLAKINKTNGYQ